MIKTSAERRSATNIQALLTKLQVEAVNAGACSGPNGWIVEADATPLVSMNPATGEPIASVRLASAAASDTVIAEAARAFQTWRERPAPKRGELVRDLGNALREYKDPLGDLVTLEMGKIRTEGHGEVQEMIDICDFAVGLSRQLYGLTLTSERPGHRMMEQWHPLGPVGVITAFNFPVAVWSWNAAIAAVCGDPVVWKPAEPTPLTAVAVQHIANRVMADHGVTGIFSLLVGPGRVVGERMLADHRLPLVSFTGSTAVGRRVAEVVASRFGRTILELGGNNAIIVDESADLKLAVPSIVFGAVGTAGQRCTTTRRVLVHKNRIDELEKKLVHAYGQVRIGNPLDPSTLMGPLIDKGAVERYQQAIQQARAAGGKVITGDKVLEGKGNFVAPTIVRAENDWPIVQHETFAPVLYLIPFDSLDEAIEMQNAAAHGLSSSIFTDRLQHAEAFLSATGSDCGIANVNIGTSGAEIGGAFGGEKDTGGGRESGSDSWKAYMRRQTNTINWSRELPLAQGITFEIKEGP